MKTLFVNQVGSAVRAQIEAELKAVGLVPEDIETALDSRLCDLEDTIDMKLMYEKTALQYAERYGIIEYEVEGNFMRYRYQDFDRTSPDNVFVYYNLHKYKS